MLAACNTTPTPEPRKTDDFCEKHSIPDALCTRKNPSLAQVFKAKGDWCDEHRTPLSFCPIHNPDAEIPNVGDDKPASISADEIEGRVVRFRNPEIEAKAGIKTVAAGQTSMGASVECLAELKFNENSVADVRAVVPGVVRSVEVQLGQRVKKGDALFKLESTRIGDIQSNLQAAKERVRIADANLKRLKTLQAQKIASDRQIEMAENELARAKSAERSSSSTLRLAGAGNSSSGRFVIRAPIDGEIVRRPAVVGVLATEAESLATIAETETLWAQCAIPEHEAGRVSIGQQLELYLPDSVVNGNVTWISPEVDSRTRTVTARAEVPNANKRLRANQFLKAKVALGDSEKSVSVPRSAIQRVEQHDVVFVRSRPGMYFPKVVRKLGTGPIVVVEGDVKVGDQIVTDGAVLLRTEVLPGSIGAGCCEVGPEKDD